MKKLISGVCSWTILFSAQAMAQEAQKAFVGDTSTVSKSIAISPDQLLKGRLSGVRVSETGGNPMSMLMTQIRGVNSSRGSSSPLWIVDGIMLNAADLDVNPAVWAYAESATMLSPETDYLSLQNAFATINPGDIESIEVLKDISASAIYGPHGANGVVIIKTKQNSLSKLCLAWESNVSVLMPVRNMEDMTGLSEYRSFQNRLGNDVSSLDGDADWQNKALKARFLHNHYLSVSGGGTLKYHLSGYLKNLQGTLKDNDSWLTGLRLNLDMLDVKGFSFGTRINLAYAGVNMTKGINELGESSSAVSLYNTPPASNAPFTPLTWGKDYDDYGDEFRALPTFYMKASIIPGLTFNLNTGVDFRTKDRIIWYGNGTPSGLANNGMAINGTFNALNFNAKAEFAYQLSLGGHNLSANAGTEAFSNRTSWLTQNGMDFFSHYLRGKGMSLRSNLVTHAKYNTRHDQFGLTGRVGYDYKGRYTVGGTLHAARSRDFDDDVILYPAVNVMWNAGKEVFYEDIKHILSTLRVRGGFGKAASEQHYPGEFFSRYNNIVPVLDDPTTSVFFKTFLRNTSREWNVGLDLGFLNDRILLSAAYYDKFTKDEIYYFAFGGPVGTKGLWEYGSRETAYRDGLNIKNKGFEVDFHSRVVEKTDWKWNLGFNLAANTNELSSVGRGAVYDENGNWIENDDVRYGQQIGKGIIANVHQNGQVAGALYGYIKRGIVSDDQIGTAPSINGMSVRTGDVYYEDLDGDNNISQADMTIIGNPHPKYHGGLYTDVSYRRFSFALAIEGAAGHDILNLDRMMRENVSGMGNISRNAYDRATAAMSSSAPDFARFGAVGTMMISDAYVEKGDYARLSRITLSYEAPVESVKWIQSLKVFLNMHNVVTLTSYDGWNPDVNSYGWDNSRQGLSYGSYPAARTLTFGVKATF